jgi:predicted acyltransferase
LPTPEKQRISAIDQFRGFAIICMVLINFGTTIETVPSWLKHAPDGRLNFPDLGAPAFIFAIGLTFGLSFRNRSQKNGVPAAYGHFIRRYLALLGMGAIVTAGETALGLNTSGVDWGVLQAIGGAGLVTLTVISFPARYRIIIGLALLAIYQLLLNAFWTDLVLRSPHGGLPGTISWSALLIIATVLADIYHNLDNRKYFPLAALLLIAAGLVLAQFVPISKNLVSASYVIITLGISSLIFFIFYITKLHLNYFAAWGQNPILLYGLSYLLIAIFALPNNPNWHTQAALWLVILQAAGILLVMGTIALYWQRKGFIFSM